MRSTLMKVCIPPAEQPVTTTSVALASPLHVCVNACMCFFFRFVFAWQWVGDCIGSIRCASLNDEGLMPDGIGVTTVVIIPIVCCPVVTAAAPAYVHAHEVLNEGHVHVLAAEVELSSSVYQGLRTVAGE